MLWQHNSAGKHELDRFFHRDLRVNHIAQPHQRKHSRGGIRHSRNIHGNSLAIVPFHIAMPRHEAHRVHIRLRPLHQHHPAELVPIVCGQMPSNLLCQPVYAPDYRYAAENRMLRHYRHLSHTRRKYKTRKIENNDQQKQAQPRCVKWQQVKQRRKQPVSVAHKKTQHQVGHENRHEHHKARAHPSPYMVLHLVH